MSMEGPKITLPTIEIKKPIRERVFLPHIEAITHAYEKHFGGETKPAEIEAIKELLCSYFEQRIENTHVYQSEKMGASFVYSVTDTARLAKELYSKFTNNKNVELSKSPVGTQRNKKEFMFVGGLVNEKNGNEYSSQEEVMHRIIEELPRALQDIKEGREPKHTEIYTLASPTNELGSVSEKFVEKLKDNTASEQFGLLYGELIASLISEDLKNGTQSTVYFNGISMGAGFALETAQKLIKDGVVTQSHDTEKDVPFLQVQINCPPGQSKLSEKIKKWQIPAGFALQIIHSFTTDPYMRNVMLGDKKFVTDKNKILEEKGITTNMSPQQRDLKKETISQVLKSLTNGVPVPNDLKVTEVIGRFDPLMYSYEFNKRVKNQRDTFIKRRETLGESLGENIVSDSQTPNRRTFGISSSHIIPFLRTSEFQRLHRVAKTLVGIMND